MWAREWKIFLSHSHPDSYIEMGMQHAHAHKINFSILLNDLIHSQYKIYREPRTENQELITYMLMLNFCLWRDIKIADLMPSYNVLSDVHTEYVFDSSNATTISIFNSCTHVCLIFLLILTFVCFLVCSFDEKFCWATWNRVIIFRFVENCSATANYMLQTYESHKTDLKYIKCREWCRRWPWRIGVKKEEEGEEKEIYRWKLNARTHCDEVTLTLSFIRAWWIMLRSYRYPQSHTDSHTLQIFQVNTTAWTKMKWFNLFVTCVMPVEWTRI